jgi:hypothetical protein
LGKLTFSHTIYQSAAANIADIRDAFPWFRKPPLVHLAKDAG